ncbi:MAG: hypothetical protein FWG17_04190 [Desulfovibrionaceae bacterium]|nr:hypothetical protein [Desulfovibrionaceae bacterium]
MADSTAAALGGLAASSAKAQFGAQVVTKTLDKLNQWGGKGGNAGLSGMAQTYDFSKEVLSAVYGGKGAIASLTG